MLSITGDHLRLTVHVLAATIWVGGQLTLAGLVPALRPFGAEVTRAAARRFNVVAWSAFAVLAVTGVWNLFVVDVGDASDDYLGTLLLKLLAVGVSGAGAAIHVVGRSKAALAAGGAMSSLGAVAALLLGIVLHS
jgi:putative copper export protein